MALSLDETVWALHTLKSVKITSLWLRRQIKKKLVPAIKNKQGRYEVLEKKYVLEDIYRLWVMPKNTGGRPKGAKDSVKRKRRKKSKLHRVLSSNTSLT